MSLWCQIAKEKNSSLKFNISSLKVINKYYNWNKRWKEVRDSAGSRGSGTEAKYFRQEKAFDQLYGTKASTKPACILNTFDYKEEETTTNKKKTHTDQNKMNENKSSDQTCQKNRRKDKKRTRKASGPVETLEKRNTEFTNKLEQLHKHKLAIFDRLLDLYEQEVNTVNSKYYQVNACLLFYLYF